ncbi:GNAT family N-acetyltransferase [uncultured Marinobacter sp.]|uniref:GNAT family N-acetyltransferase n=1 Tax=uncultured Marinobacter sp. TaxID=187379 RepID=UPI0030DD1B1B
MREKQIMPVEIQVAETAEQFDDAGGLIRAYADFLGHDLEFQGFTAELASLPEMYGPPGGAMLVARIEGLAVGVVGLRHYEPHVAEMKRMYVLGEYSGMGIGRALTKAFLEKAREMGYHSVLLDSIPELDKALKLYRNIGFREIEPYRYNPHPDAVFMEYKIF